MYWQSALFYILTAFHALSSIHIVVLQDIKVSGTNTLYICFLMVHREEEENEDRRE